MRPPKLGIVEHPLTADDLRTVKPTVYNGILFRSRTEARWAVFLDWARVEWKYEAETFDLPEGRYLPDFYVVDWRMFIEVKGPGATEVEIRKCVQLHELTGKKVYLAIGQPSALLGLVFPGAEFDVFDYGALAVCRRCPAMTFALTQDGYEPYCTARIGECLRDGECGDLESVAGGGLERPMEVAAAYWFDEVQPQ